MLHFFQERERQFEIDVRRAKGLEVKRMLEDGNCLFRAVADQVYGDCEAYNLVRQMCIDYMVGSFNAYFQSTHLHSIFLCLGKNNTARMTIYFYHIFLIT
ncbi:hypothetical protein CsSME_00040399 [Camellia sinensis var. sinensis]